MNVNISSQVALNYLCSEVKRECVFQLRGKDFHLDHKGEEIVGVWGGCARWGGWGWRWKANFMDPDNSKLKGMNYVKYYSNNLLSGRYANRPAFQNISHGRRSPWGAKIWTKIMYEEDPPQHTHTQPHPWGLPVRYYTRCSNVVYEHVCITLIIRLHVFADLFVNKFCFCYRQVSKIVCVFLCQCEILKLRLQTFTNINLVFYHYKVFAMNEHKFQFCEYE